MKIDLQYVNDTNGNTQAVLLPLSEWEKVLNKLKEYEQTLQLRSDLKEAFDQVAVLRNNKQTKQLRTELELGEKSAIIENFNPEQHLQYLNNMPIL